MRQEKKRWRVGEVGGATGADVTATGGTSVTSGRPDTCHFLFRAGGGDFYFTSVLAQSVCKISVHTSHPIGKIDRPVIYRCLGLNTGLPNMPLK